MCGDPTLSMVLTSRLKITSMNERRQPFIEIGKQNDESKCQNVIVNNVGLSNGFCQSRISLAPIKAGYARHDDRKCEVERIFLTI